MKRGVMETVALSQRKESDGLSPEYRFFGSVMLGCAADQLPLAVRAILAWAESEARRSVRYGRSSEEELTLGLRLAYNALKTEAATVRGPSLDTPPTEPVLHAAARLRHRQRAILILRYGLGLQERETSRVIGIRKNECAAITACAVSRLAKHLRRPMDVSWELHKAGQLMKRSCSAGSISDAKPATPAVVTPIHRTTSVVERLIAAPIKTASAPAVDEQARDQVVVSVPLPSRGKQSRPRPMRGWSLVGRLAAVIGIGALFAWAVWPVYG
ncbi:MAG: SigE family RNA polymerase sigma factor [Actinomycetota bacterium]